MYILTTDACDIGLGAILSTAQGKVIEYASWVFTPAEKNYATITKESLAIVWAVRKFRHYLIGAHFTVRTDHKPLEWLESSKTSKSHLQRLEHWSLKLRAFDFDIIHQPGCKNLNADTLSRRPIAVVGITSPISEREVSYCSEKRLHIVGSYKQNKILLTPECGHNFPGSDTNNHGLNLPCNSQSCVEK